jgi:sortase A
VRGIRIAATDRWSIVASTHTDITARLVAERLAWTIGVVGLGVWLIASACGAVGARHEIARFAALQRAARLSAAAPDLRLWSPERIRAWRETRAQQDPEPLAVLRIPRIRLEAAVLEGTDDWSLNRAVGHIAGTAVPGADGNCGIAGHRDGFFRGLKDIGPDDVVEMETLDTVDVYRVERIWIVDPDDVSVLDPTDARALTLVTCYPFYFIGSAPRRFIVRAVHVRSKGT